MTATATFVAGAIAITDNSRLAAEAVNARLLSWYQSEIQPQVAAAQDLATAAANFLEDVFASGLHWYVMPPSFGGFGAVEDTVLPGLSDPTIPDAPRFSEDMYAGGILVLLTGPPYVLYEVSSLLISTLAARPATAQRALQQLSTQSAVAGPAMAALTDLAVLPQAAWSDSTTTFKNMFNATPVAQILKSASEFPQKWVQSTEVEVARLEPDAVRVRTPFTLQLFGRGFLATDRVRINNVLYTPAVADDGSGMQVELPATALTTAGQTRVAVARAGADAAWRDLTVEQPQVLETLAELSGSELYGWHQFDIWAPFSGLDPWKGVAQLIPGAAQIASAVTATLDAVGDPATGAAVNNFATSALRASSRSVTSTATRARTDLQRLQSGIQQLSTATAALGASVLVVPPVLGGNHQLGYALRQGLNGYALNTPLVDPDAAVAGMFICAGDTDRARVIAALNQVSSVLQMVPWSPLA
jgi:hypothetical protein